MLQRIKQFLTPHHRALKFGDDYPIHPTHMPHRKEASIEDIYYCFRLLLDRSPHNEEWAGHSARAGEQLEEVVKTYLNSREFSERKLFAQREEPSVRMRHNGMFNIYANDQDTIIGVPALNGAYEPLVFSRIREVLKSGSSFLDVGANIGYFSLAAAQIVGGNGKVIAVEPNPENVRLFMRSIAANGYENIQIAQVAASERVEPILLHATVGNGTTSKIGDGDNLSHAKLIPGVPIDNLLSSRDRPIDLIKMDVEGFEPIALSGARGLIATDKPHLIFEFSATDLVGADPWSFLSMLRDWGYHFSPILDGFSSADVVTSDELFGLFEQQNSSHIDVHAYFRVA